MRFQVKKGRLQRRRLPLGRGTDQTGLRRRFLPPHLGNRQSRSCVELSPHRRRRADKDIYPARSVSMRTG
jgi:hypothetical protein